jgi:hypothetical protein
VHGIYVRLLHTFVLTDFLLAAMLLAVAITPLGLASSGRPRLPRLSPGLLTGASSEGAAGFASP